MSAKLTMKEFMTPERSWWCPGCGDFGVLAALQKALVNLGKQPHEIALIAGIGCSGKIGNYINCYNIHVTHGRTLPVATGVKMANRGLTVLAAGGDGDGYAIGMSHFIHAMRRNVDITYIVMDNHIYGLTKGQVSPTSDPGFKTKSSPAGNIERPVRPLEMALAAGCGFVAQGFSSWQGQLVKILETAINHKGFSLVNVISPCVTYNKVNTYDFYKEGLVNLDEVEGYNRSDRAAALRHVIEHDGMVGGIVYQEEQPTSYEDLVPGFRQEPIVQQDWAMPKDVWNKILAELK